jgi:hypothetical protein
MCLRDLPDELGPGHVERGVNRTGLRPRIVFEDFHHQRGVVGKDHAFKKYVGVTSIISPGSVWFPSAEWIPTPSRA